MFVLFQFLRRRHLQPQTLILISPTTFPGLSRKVNSPDFIRIRSSMKRRPASVSVSKPSSTNLTEAFVHGTLFLSDR